MVDSERKRRLRRVQEDARLRCWLWPTCDLKNVAPLYEPNGEVSSDCDPNSCKGMAEISETDFRSLIALSTSSSLRSS